MSTDASLVMTEIPPPPELWEVEVASAYSLAIRLTSPPITMSDGPPVQVTVGVGEDEQPMTTWVVDAVVALALPVLTLSTPTPKDS